GARVPCGSSLCRFGAGFDWMLFYVPLGFLGKIFQVEGYPFQQDNKKFEWRSQVDDWLTGIARHVFQGFPFQLALVGFEVEIADISSQRVQIAGIPKERSEGFLLAG